MSEKYAYGIASVKFGTPTGSNTMPQTLNLWAQTVQGTLNLAEDESQVKTFPVEETSVPVHQTVTEPGKTKINWEAYDITPALAVVVRGGTAGTTGSGASTKKTWAAPTNIEPIELALEITTTNGVVFNFYKVSVLARYEGSVSREELLRMKVDATVLDPGNGASPWGYSLPDPQA
jgi:hypothetical protein